MQEATFTHQPPLIGITGRQGRGSDIGSPRGFSDAPLDIYLREYAESIARSGGIAVHIPLETDAVAVVDRLDGLIIAGGEDVDPRRYGQIPGPHVPVVDPLRDEVELALLRAAETRGIPVVGICRGQQLINVAFGGTLIQHLEPGEGETHMGTQYPRAHRVHEVTLEAGSVAHSLYGEHTLTNTFHHQAVDRLGEGLTITGRAPDGVIEAIEAVGKPIIAVQWHPECFGGDPIFAWLVDQAKHYTPIAPPQAKELSIDLNETTHNVAQAAVLASAEQE